MQAKLIYGDKGQKRLGVSPGIGNKETPGGMLEMHYVSIWVGGGYILNVHVKRIIKLYIKIQEENENTSQRLGEHFSKRRIR